MKRIIMALAAALIFFGVAPAQAAQPLKSLSYLLGTWNCTSGGQTYTASYAYTNGGTWLRTINASKGSASEDMMTYARGRWTIIDMEPTGQWSVLSAPDTGVTHIASRTLYPKPGLNVTFDRKSARQYTLTFSGTFNGKAAHWVDACVRRSP